MKIRTLFFLSLLILFACQQKADDASIHESIKLETDRIFGKLVEIRRDFHENPELAGNEIRTQKIIEQYLLDLGLDVETNVYGHGVVGILRGEKEGRKIAWRSDMDALPSDYPDEVAFKSKTKGIAVKTLDDIYGKGLVYTSYGQVPFFNDDFAYFQQRIPGVYFFLGGSDLEKGINAMNHAPDFQVDEESIRTGVRSFSSLIVKRLREDK